MVFIFKAHGDAVISEGPQGFLEAIIQFAIPFAPEELDDLRAAMQEFGAVAPFGVLGVGERYAFGVAGIPGILGGLHFLARGFFGKGRQWRAWIHFNFLF